MFHASADKSGFFIDKTVATYLQDDKDGHIRSGYHTEAINSRGVHIVDETGKEDYELEVEYCEKARKAESNGMFRFADTLRNIAAFYHEEGERYMGYA